MRPRPALLVLLLTALAGCAEGGDGQESTTPASSGPTAEGLDACPSGGSVAGWTEHGGDWVRLDAAAGHTDLVCGTADAALSHLVDGASGPFTDVAAAVEFNMLAGDSGAGLVLHYADEGNYTIVRYSIREQGWHLFTMIDGTREKRDEASVMPPPTNPELHQWVRLRVLCDGGHVTAYDGELKVIDYALPAEASHQGRVGYFLRDAGMAALFDGFVASAA